MELCLFFFGVINHRYKEAYNSNEITLEENRQIDRKIGYIPELPEGQKDYEDPRDSYSDIVFKQIAREVKNTEEFKNFLKTQGIIIPNTKSEEEIVKIRDFIITQKIKYITQLIKWKEKNIGPNEIKQFYVKLLGWATFNKLERPKFRTYEFSKQIGEKIDIISFIELNVQDGPIYYIYSKEEFTYIPISHAELKERIAGYTERKGKKLLIDEEQEEKCKTKLSSFKDDFSKV